MFKGVTLQGVSAAKAAFRALPEAQRDEHNDNTLQTVGRIERLAQANAPSRRGNLRNAIASKFTKSTGTGIVGVRKMMIVVPQQRFLKSFRAEHTTTKYTNVYGRFVHDGSLHNPNPDPFMLEAAVAATDAYISSAKQATERANAKVCNGARFL